MLSRFKRIPLMDYFTDSHICKLLKYCLTGLKTCLDMKSAVVGGIVGVGVIKFWTLYKGTAEKKVSFCDALFFSPAKTSCTEICSLKYDDRNSYVPCNECSIRKLKRTLSQAQKSLEICMYLIALKDISHIVVQLFKKGVDVKVIIDKHMSYDAQGADVNILHEAHIPIKLVESAYIMHNKFVIIDEETVMSGSLNWTKQGTLGNYENVVVVRDRDVARKFKHNFESIWNCQNC